MAKYKRSRFFVDAKVQGALAVRAFVYWLMCLIIMAIWLVGWDILTQPVGLFSAHISAAFDQYGAAAIASLLLLPIVLLDIIHLSNRFAGPMHRLQREVRKALDGEPVGEVRLRDGDYWQEFTNDLSKVLNEYLSLKQAAPPRIAPTGEPCLAPQSDETLVATAV